MDCGLAGRGMDCGMARPGKAGRGGARNGLDQGDSRERYSGKLSTLSPAEQRAMPGRFGGTGE